ncbi:hypothetical protein [Streptomyces sp. NPDC049813]
MTMPDDRQSVKRRQKWIKPPGKVLTAWLTALGAAGTVIKIVVELASFWM